ncbi:hypothetical protein PV327_005509 [Microctonus hyperodae]|uniref:DNA repair protein complementing XP-G cells n=1 Tax=Microctonus hyperodae TaxID=165561 RepID=A0AA39G2A2_MICHY|nr:hypothetical protein PV327_005509 [Microctonus hyperodae]
MGVTGLWRLIDASGKPVPLETLEGKVLAIDISIWIHQVLQGYQDCRGNTVPNAHLLGLFSRICKLLYFKIKPVFVFDGGVPLLKKNTIAARKKRKAIAAGKAVQMKNDLLQNLMKHSIIKGVLAHKTGEKVETSTSSSQKNSNQTNDMFMLPLLSTNLPDDQNSTESDSSVELSPRKQTKWKGNIHTVDVTSNDFKALPVDVRYDILTDLKETRKQNSWGRLHEIPQETHQFSNYQMQRLLKRRKVQESLEEAEQEMGGKNLTLDELEKLMLEQGVDVQNKDTAFRIAADSTTRLIYINDLKALKSKSDTSDSVCEDSSKPGCSSERESDETLPSIIEESTNVVENIDEYDLDNEWDSDIEVIDKPIDDSSIKKYFGKTSVNPALSYMIEHSGLSQEQIFALIEQSRENVRNANKNEKLPKRTKLNFNDESIVPKKRGKIISRSNVEAVKEKIEIKEKLKTPPLESSNVSSDSESDGFVEVPDVPVPHRVVEKNTMEITVKPSEKFDNTEDIFADVFETKSITHNTSIDSSSNKDDSVKNVTIDQLEEINMLNSPATKELEVIPEPIELNSSVEETLVNDASSQNTSSPKNNQQKSLESQEEIPQAVDEDLSEISAKSDSNQNLDALMINSSSTSIEITAIPVEKDQSTEREESTQSPIKPTNERGMSERVENIIERLNADSEEILANIDKSEELLNMKSQLENKNQELQEHIGKLDRQATEVTEQMRSDAQDLLRLFGIPYVVAPQEAEAQCAYLEMINLTDGTITDDSDIWLFGGRCVYKNFFNNAKRVMEYRSKDIEHHFKLTREQMIQLALLVGSDYTIGINGIGPVTGLEILASFPAEGNDLLRGLMKFSSWIKAGRQAGPGRASLRNKLRNIVVDQSFPSQAVVQAYLFPTVDESKEIFTWSKPNLVLLSDYTREKFGWSKLKFDETMGPVMKRLTDTKSQKNIMSYFKVQTVPKSIDENLSKRVKKAVRMMDKNDVAIGDDSDNIEETLENIKKNAGKKSRKTTRKKKKDELNDDNKGDDEQEKNEVDKFNKDLPTIIMKDGKNTEEYIPQREKERAAALQKKLQAIEIFKKSRKCPGKSGKKSVRPARKIVQKEAQLSESSSDTN